MILDASQATELAREKVHQFAAYDGDEYELLLAQTIEVEGGWVFFYNTVDFIHTGDPSSRLAGNGPIFVSRMGTVHELSSAVPWEQQLAKITKADQ